MVGLTVFNLSMKEGANRLLGLRRLPSMDRVGKRRLA